tara:strand:- start:1195 stop:1413 length:219 start_codon:yes stop_codon:yes gene_type:complete
VYSISQGQLAFLPSDSMLVQFNGEQDDWVSSWKRLKEPLTVLVLAREEDTPYCKILYNGEPWLARNQDLYPV